METTTKLSPGEILEILPQFIGTTEYYTHNIGAHKLLLTEGCHFIREYCGAYWFFDAIISHRVHSKIPKSYMQIWKLEKVTDYWVLSCKLDDDKIHLVQHIEFSDFPLREITIWIENGVALLPTEH